jgi:hypothetical protein
VNAHNHSFQSLLRGLGDDLDFMGWRDRVLYPFSRRLDARGIEVGATFAFAEMLRHGITTVVDFFYVLGGGNANAEAAIRAARRVGIRLVLARAFYALLAQTITAPGCTGGRSCATAGSRPSTRRTSSRKCERSHATGGPDPGSSRSLAVLRRVMPVL